jgi:hypothetical protein
MRDEVLRAELVTRARKARQLQARLVETGQMGPGYHAEQEALDGANADWLNTVFDRVGWPGRNLVSDDGAAAAVQLLQRAVGRPAVQRRGVELMLEAAPKGQASMVDAAHFADRIAVFEGKPQLFGTQLDWADNGELHPAPVENPDQLDARRAAVGLPPIGVLMAHARQAAVGGPPPDLEERRAAFDDWARKVGWRA